MWGSVACSPLLRTESMSPYDSRKNSARMPARVFRRGDFPPSMWQAIHGEFSAANTDPMDDLYHRRDWLCVRYIRIVDAAAGAAAGAARDAACGPWHAGVQPLARTDV